MAKFSIRYKKLIPEPFIGLVLIILVAAFLVPPKITIKADGQGYYDYLPALFIYKDFPKKGIDPSSVVSDRINGLGMYINFKDYKIDKYPCGTAVLMSPFFLLAHITAPLFGAERDGYSAPYQFSILLAALFYLLFGLYFLRKLLELYDISRLNIVLVQVLAAFGTGLTHHTYYDPSFSHIYSFFAITAFLFFTKAYFLKKDNSGFILASLFLGLVILIRQINGLVILFIPFIAGSFPVLKDTVLTTLKKPGLVLKTLVIVLLFLSIQSILWYIETGHFFIYSYQGERFNFLKPAFSNVLFSYRKGLFVYAPLLFFSLAGLYFLIIKKSYFQLFTWLAFFVLLTYMISSWWSWSYGASFGHRAFIDFYAVFLIPLAFSLQYMKKPGKWGFLVLCMLTIPVNLIQTKQYRGYILHWGDMDKQGYWKVFLHLEDRYKGILWKRHYDFNQSGVAYLDSLSLGNIKIPPNLWTSIFKDRTNKFPSFSQTNILQMQFKNRFSSSEKAKIVITINDTVSNKPVYYHEVPVIHFADDKLNKNQLGTYNFEFHPLADSGQYVLDIHTKSEEDTLSIEDLKIRFIDYEK